MTTISSFGSAEKMAGVLNRALIEVGAEPNIAQPFTIMWPSPGENVQSPRIVLVIEPRAVQK